MWPESDKTTGLIREAREGNRRAVDDLLSRHRQAVERMVQMRLDQKIRRRVDVSDVVQEVFLDVNRRLEDYLANPQMPFHLWLRQIAKDRIIDAHRRHRVSARRSIDREQPMVVPSCEDRSTIQFAAQLCDDQLTPAAEATKREMSRRVEEAMTGLAEADLEILVMRHYEHLTNQEVAQVLELTEPAASMRYLRAIRRLREVLGADESSGS